MHRTKYIWTGRGEGGEGLGGCGLRVGGGATFLHDTQSESVSESFGE